MKKTVRRDPTPEKPAVSEAPDYMGQYASLMTILLAFFIVMLTLGQDRVAKFKDGVGGIRNLIGVTGGSGLMDFWRASRRPPAPKVIKEERDPDAALIGYEIGSGDAFSLDPARIQSIDFEDPGRSSIIRSGIRFDPNRIGVSRDSRVALDQAVALLVSVPPGYSITVGVRMHGDTTEAARQLAARRATWLMRHFIEQGRIPATRIRSIGLVAGVKPDHPAYGSNDVFFGLRQMGHDDRVSP